MYKTIPIILTLSLLLSCSKSDIAIKSNEKKLQYLALGDSYTIGEGVEDNERWPVVLRDQLVQEGTFFSPPKIIATTGWTTGDLLKAIDQENTGTYDLVSLLIGVNNQYRGLDFQVYDREFRMLLQKAISLAGNDPSKVFVVSIPDYSITPFGQTHDPQKIRDEIDAYNRFNYQVSAEMGVLYFDITPMSRKAEKDESLLAEDRLHPSGKMYQEWVALIFPEINAVFNKGK